MPRGTGTLNPGLARAPGGTIPGWGFTTQTFDEIEDFIDDMKDSLQRQRQGMDLLVRLMVLATKGYAQQFAMGPVAPRQRSVPALAHRIPVQRITGMYFAGWTQRRTGPTTWLLYNDSFEAHLIEFGIHMRTRRPILKMSIIEMLRFLQSTRTGDRLAEGMLGPRRGANGQFRSFENRVRAFKLSWAGINVAGPQGRLP